MNIFCLANNGLSLLVNSASPFCGGNIWKMTMYTDGAVLSPVINASDHYYELDYSLYRVENVWTLSLK